MKLLRALIKPFLKTVLSLFLIFSVLAFSSTSAKADYFSFAVVGVNPTNYYSKAVVVDIVGFANFSPWGWRAFYLNIDGYNYPVSNWNAFPTSPNSIRAWFEIPNNFWGTHRLQLIVEAWAQPYYGYPVPVGYYYSFPQFYSF